MALAATAAAAPEEPAAGAGRLVLDASRALQAGSAARFLSYFDKQAYADFSALRRQVTALTETRTVASSVEVLSLVEKQGIWRVRVDWLLQLTPAAGPGPLERRRETVELEIGVLQDEGPRIRGLRPLEFFRPR